MAVFVENDFISSLLLEHARPDFAPSRRLQLQPRDPSRAPRAPRTFVAIRPRPSAEPEFIRFGGARRKRPRRASPTHYWITATSWSRIDLSSNTAQFCFAVTEGFALDTRHCTPRP